VCVLLSKILIEQLKYSPLFIYLYVSLFQIWCYSILCIKISLYIVHFIQVHHVIYIHWYGFFLSQHSKVWLGWLAGDTKRKIMISKSINMFLFHQDQQGFGIDNYHQRNDLFLFNILIEINTDTLEYLEQ